MNRFKNSSTNEIPMTETCNKMDNSPWLGDYSDMIGFVTSLEVRSLTEWHIKHSKSYLEALRQKMQKVIARELGWGQRMAWSTVSDEEIKQMAIDSGCSGLKNWKNNHPVVYAEACKRKIQKKIAEELGWNVPIPKDWFIVSDEEIKQMAADSGATGLTDWYNKHRVSYSCAIDRKIQRKIAKELGWEVQSEGASWSTVSDEQLKQMAIDSGCSGLTNWKNNHPVIYAEACRRKIQKKIAEELGWNVPIPKDWSIVSDEEIKQMAIDSGATGLTDWYNKHRVSYTHAIDRKIQRKIAKELGWEVQSEGASWSTISDEQLKQMVMSLGLKGLRQWSKKHQSSYRIALGRKIHRKIADDLNWETNIDWRAALDEEIKEMAYDSGATGLTDWENNHKGSYLEACNRKIQRKIAEELGWKINGGDVLSLLSCVEL